MRVTEPDEPTGNQDTLGGEGGTVTQDAVPPSPPSPPKGPSERPPVPPRPPQWRPGQVPWGWRQTVLGAAVAAAPIVLLTLLTYVSARGASTTSTKPTLSGATFSVVVTVIFDSWFVFVAWIFSLRGPNLTRRSWGFRRPPMAMLWVVPVGLVAVYLVNLVYNTLVTTKTQAVVNDFPRSLGGLLLFILLACIVAPLFEETFFRGFLFQGFASSFGPIWGAVVSATLFSLSHQQLDIFVPLFALGVALAWAFYYTRSLWANVALHSLFNAIAVLAWALTK
jgi:membrane protease YdiL (CAAX protease family)